MHIKRVCVASLLRKDVCQVSILWSRIRGLGKYVYKTCVLRFYYVKMHAKYAPEEPRAKWYED